MIDQTTYMVQRLSALFMIPFVLVHLGVMIIAVQDGLTAREILARTSGNPFWALFYGGFVCSVSLHAAIGVGTILFETFALSRRTIMRFTFLFAIFLLAMGMAAVIGVIWPR